MRRLAALLIPVLLLWGCSRDEAKGEKAEEVAQDEGASESGSDSAESVDGLLWYRLDIKAAEHPSVPATVGLPAEGAGMGVLANGDERLEMPVERRADGSTVMRFPGGTLTLRVVGDAVSGRWRLDIGQMQATAEVSGRATAGPDPAERFPAGEPPEVNVSGVWGLEVDAYGKGKLRLEQSDDGLITGSAIIADFGDVRTISGRVLGDRFIASGFDGPHVFLIRGKVFGDGDRLLATLTLAGLQQLDASGVRGKAPGALDLLVGRVAEGARRLSIPELEARKELKGKPVIVDLFGTWCPACLDLTPTLVALHEKYADQGLHIVSVAIEPTGNTERTQKRLDEFKERYGVVWPVELRETDDIIGSLPKELEVGGFPVTVFLKPDGTIHAVHTSFISPAASDDHQVIVDQFDTWAREIVDAK